MTKLELENKNENRAGIREKLTLEKLENDSILVATFQVEEADTWCVDNAFFIMTSCTISKEQIKEVIEFLTKSLEGK